ncbi:MAG: S41 family peptidase [Bacteroidales bacterium]|nr:S41 family peptidase [Bacteroidales bacterium]
MKTLCTFMLLTLTLTLPIQAQNNAATPPPLYFAAHPTLSPDAQTLYFCYEGDIWKVAVSGGQALRVTAMTGYEIRPRISPDGKWLAFTSNEQGNDDVYVVSVDGGPIRRLTFHDAYDRVTSWSADSKYIYFESNRYNSISAYRVSIEGGTPERLFGDYYNTIANLVENPVNGSFYFNESAESYNYLTRKRYKGDNCPQIVNWDPKSMKYTELTTYKGKDVWPMVDKNGTLYWACDSINDVYNIAVLKNGKPQILTNFKEAILYPQISFNGQKIVYLRDYQIEVFDVASGSFSKPVIALAANNETKIEHLYNVENTITNMAISPDGLKLAFVSRGRLFVSDAKGKFAKELPTDPKERVVDVVWDKDSKNLYLTRSRMGWFNLYKIGADGAGKERAVYTPDAFVQSLTASHDHSKLVFFTGNDKLELLSTGTESVSTLATIDLWAFRVPPIHFSKDDEWVTFTAMNHFEQDIYVCKLSTKELINLTNSVSIESAPVWSADGKYIYFTANPLTGSFPRGVTTQLYRMALDKYSAPFAADKFSDLFNRDTTRRTPARAPITINPHRIYDRWEQLAPNGSQSNPQIFVQNNRTWLLYHSTHEGTRKLYKQELLDFDQKPAEEVRGGNTLSRFSYNGKDLFALGGGRIYKVDLAAGSVTDLTVRHGFNKNNADEFQQMFYEVWAQLAQNFYDVDYHGVDWKATQEYYASFLPHVKNRADLRTLINDMLGELNSSHLGFSSTGREERSATSIQSAETGILFDNARPYIVASVVEGSPADKREVDIRKGDRLVAVNGVPVDEKENRERYFSAADPKPEIALTFARDGRNRTYNLHTFRTANLRNALYNDWVDGRRSVVDAQTQGRVAYLHMTDMSTGSLNRFLSEMNRDAIHKDALILDLRFNNGGNVHNEVLEFLMQKRYFTWSYRDQPRSTHPGVTPADKPIVVLINERSLSDAEVTSNGIKSLGIAPLIGTETYRWVIFTSSVSLVDGSSSRMPAWGCYNLKGEDMELVGVAPDIYIRNTFEDRLLGRDPQLDRGIEEVMKMLR